MATLLLGNPETTWREWLKANRKGRDLVVLDPGEPTLAPGGQLVLYRGDKPVKSRFFGSVDPNRSPHVLIAAAAQFSLEANADAIYQLAPYAPSPLGHQTVHLLAQLLLKGEHRELLIASGTHIEQSGFPIGPTLIDLEKAFPRIVSAAQRKAQWLAFFERAELQTLDLSRLTIEGGRLGSGRILKPTDLPNGPQKGILYAEQAGSNLFLVTEQALSDDSISHLLDYTHSSRIHIVHPEDYANLFVGLTRESGEDFALGVLQSIDFQSMIATLWSDAVPPAPARLLRLGSIKVTKNGPEPQEPRPWTL